MLLDAYADESRRLKETQDTADELLDMIGVLHVTVKDQNQALKVSIRLDLRDSIVFLRGVCLFLVTLL